jgi:hypothetical protein
VPPPFVEGERILLAKGGAHILAMKILRMRSAPTAQTTHIFCTVACHGSTTAGSGGI